MPLREWIVVILLSATILVPVWIVIGWMLP